MTGADHYREAEKLLKQADGEFTDDSDDAAPRREYANTEEWYKAIEIAQEMREQKARTAALLTRMAQVHATLALAAATALTGSMASPHFTDEPEIKAWHAAAGTESGEVPDAS